MKLVPLQKRPKRDFYHMWLPPYMVKHGCLRIRKWALTGHQIWPCLGLELPSLQNCEPYISVYKALILRYFNLFGLLQQNTADSVALRQMFISAILEAGKSKTKVWAGPVSGEGPLPVLLMVAFLLYPHLMERDLWPFHPFLTAAISSSASILMASFEPSYLLKASPPNTITLEIRVSVYEFRETH